jgi:hypothetical protein
MVVQYPYVGHKLCMFNEKLMKIENKKIRRKEELNMILKNH